MYLMTKSYDLKLISNVDYEGIGDGLNGDPSVTVANLETRHILVRVENGHPTRIRMRRKAQGEIGLRAFWVIVKPHACTQFISSKCLLKIILFQPKICGKHLHQFFT